MKSQMYEIHTYKEKDNLGNRCYSYLIRQEYRGEVNYLSSMGKYESPTEARIAATLLMDKNYLGK